MDFRAYTVKLIYGVSSGGQPCSMVLGVSEAVSVFIIRGWRHECCVPTLYLSYIKHHMERPAISHIISDYRPIILHAIYAGTGHDRPPRGPSWDGRQTAFFINTEREHNIDLGTAWRYSCWSTEKTEEEAHFKARPRKDENKKSWSRTSTHDLKPGMTVLARASSNLTDLPTQRWSYRPLITRVESET
jgi:hypothetical protein